MLQDIVALLKPSVMFLRILGVCPSSLRNPFIHICTYVYSTFLAIISIQFNLQLVYYFFWHSDGILCGFDTFTGVWIQVNTIVLIVSPILQSRELVKFFKVMESVQRSLLSLNIRQPGFPSKIMQAFIICVLCFTVVGTVLNNTRYEPYPGFVWGRLPSAMVSIGTTYKISVLISLVNHKVGLLNWHLKDLDQNWPPFLPRPSTPSSSYHDLSHEAMLRRKRVVHEGLDTRKLSPGRVRAFNVAHLKLHYAYRKLNSVFSIPLFFLYTSEAIHISHHILRAFQDKDKRGVGSHVLYIVQKGLAIIMMSTLITCTEKNFRKTGHLVLNLLDDDRHSSDVKAELEAFTKILLHRRTSFSAAGFFNVNLKIVTRMVTLLAPIVLFLVQNAYRPRRGRNSMPQVDSSTS